MKLRNWLTLGGLSIGTIGMGMAISSFLPQRFDTRQLSEQMTSEPDQSAFPAIDVQFLRCASVTLPEWLAVRGAFSREPKKLVYSAVLIRHPQGTFLYDSGMNADIQLFLMDQSFYFKHTIGLFHLEQSISGHLQALNMQPSDLDFVVLSHLHWDHVSGIPDLPAVPLRVNRVEYEAATQGHLDLRHGLVRRLLGNNPVDLLDFKGPPYEGFRSSFDLFGDGSIVLVPLPGHTAGQMGMFINRSNGSRVFLIGDAAWFADNYLAPATMHPFLWSQITSDDATARQTLLDLHHFAHRRPEVPMIAMHDGQMQDTFMEVERLRSGSSSAMLKNRR